MRLGIHLQGVLLTLALSACSRGASDPDIRTHVVQGDGYQIEFRIVANNKGLHRVSVRGIGVVPYAYDGITRDEWGKEFERMVAKPGRWERAEIRGSKIRFTMGYIGLARHCFARINATSSDGYSISLIDGESEHVKFADDTIQYDPFPEATQNTALNEGPMPEDSPQRDGR